MGCSWPKASLRLILRNPEKGGDKKNPKLRALRVKLAVNRDDFDLLGLVGIDIVLIGLTSAPFTVSA